MTYRLLNINMEIMEEFNECTETESYCIQLVFEFLICNNLNKTVEVFVEEIQSSDFSLPEKMASRKERISKKNAMEMLSSLNSGNHLEFFKSWTGIPKSIREEREYENVTVLLHTYFATLPLRVEPNYEEEPVTTKKTIPISKEEPVQENEEISVPTKETIPITKVLLEPVREDKEQPVTSLRINPITSLLTSETVITELSEQISTASLDTEKSSETITHERDPNEKTQGLESLELIKAESSTDNIFQVVKVSEVSEVGALQEQDKETEENKNKEDKTEKNKQVEIRINYESFKEKDENTTGMEMFKNYLLENKYRFRSETEHLPLFALPFIENPKEHHAFTEIFMDKWVIDLKNALKTFLIKYCCGDSVVPEMMAIIREEKKLKTLAKKKEGGNEELTKRYHDIKSKLHKLKRDHKQLVGVANELTTALENSVRGQAVDLNTTLQKCATIFPDVFPLTHTSRKDGLKKLLEKKTVNLSPLQLDMKKIKEDLSTGSMKTKLILLQALRLYLCDLSSDERVDVIHWLRSEDVLGLCNDGLTVQWLQSPAHPLQQAVARWLNLLTSLRSGREYVASSALSLLPLIVAAARRPAQEAITKDMLLASLQKLSLRKELCETMLEEGTMDWLGQELWSMSSDYGLQYSTSLFMNLALLAPRSYWDTRPHQVLPVLINLLKSSNQQIVQFACGSLYCLLRSDKVNIFARSVNLASELATLSSGPLKRQVEALTKLHQRVLNPSAAQITIHHQCTEWELEDPEDIEPEINNFDLVKGSLSGDELLYQKYSVVFTAPCVVDREQVNQTVNDRNLPSWAQ